MTRALLPYGADRPLASIVAMDPAYTGPTGLAVIELAKDQAGIVPRVWVGDARSHECFRWLGEQVAAVTPRGTRSLLVVESDAWGPGVARKLGIAVGAVEGLLVDLNAIVPGTRVDVRSGTWRTVLGKRIPAGRAAKKALAIRHAAKHWGIPELGPDASEALCLLEYALSKYSYGDVIC